MKKNLKKAAIIAAAAVGFVANPFGASAANASIFPHTDILGCSYTHYGWFGRVISTGSACTD